MPKKVETGSATIDLLDYLLGPGERDEHVDQHLVAGWDPDLPCPARTPGRMSYADLVLLLDAPVEALRGPKPEEHVWHVSVRNAPGDRLLSDAELAVVATEMVHAAGIAEHGDEQACRWIAVRHADDHIHILATLARQDGRHPRVRGDILAMHTAARVFEARWGLTPMSPLDRTARRRPVTSEAEKAARRGLAFRSDPVVPGCPAGYRRPQSRTTTAWPTRVLLFLRNILSPAQQRLILKPANKCSRVTPTQPPP